MKTAILLLSSFLSLAAAVLSQPNDPPLLLRDVTVVDVENGSTRPNVDVVISGERITALGARDEVDSPSNARVLEAKGKYLIPGLWDMHVHIVFGDWFPGGGDVILPLFVANGVTGVRDMGGELEVLLQWRKEIEDGSLIGPRMVLSGPMLDGPKPRFPSSVAVSTPEDGRRAVSDLKRRGADFIKLQSLIPREAVFAIADEARKLGIPFAGHVPDAVRAVEASDAGQKSFEHLIGLFEGSSPREAEFLRGPKGPGRFLESFDADRASELIAHLAKNGTWQCPTLVWERGGTLLENVEVTDDPLLKYAPASWREGTWRRFTDEMTRDPARDDAATRRRFVEKELEMVSAMHRAGIPFLAGTDTAAGVRVFPGFSLHEELELFVSAGFTPLEALQTATILPARFLGGEEQLGSVAVGKIADLVLLDENPLANIHNSRAIRAVVLNGRFLDRAELDAMLRKVEDRAAAR